MARVGVSRRGQSDSANLESIVTAFEALAPPGVRVGALWIDEVHEQQLRGTEESAIAGSAPHRRREFASGRALLRQLIGSDVEVPIGPARAPELPPGLRGSLAHDGEVAVGAVADGRRFAAVGIDIDSRQILDDAVIATVRRPDEGLIDPMLLFVIKEAVYKAWSGSGGGFIDHHAVRVRVSGSHFHAEVVPFSASFRGGFGFVGDRILALTTAPLLECPHHCG